MNGVVPLAWWPTDFVSDDTISTKIMTHHVVLFVNKAQLGEPFLGI